MPTGYTAMIDEDPTLTAAKWVTEGLSRNFGVCISLRDHGTNLTEEQIEKYLKENIERSTKYYREELAKTEKALAYINENPVWYWTKEYDSTVKRLTDYNKINTEEKEKTRLRHQQIKKDLIKLHDNTEDEVTRKIAEFGLNQLELVKSETEPYIQKIPTLEEYKQDKMQSLTRDLTYYKKHIEETEEREKERLLIYQTIRSEVSEILSVDTHETRSKEGI